MNGPYWGLRDYGATGQLGLEATPEEYVANMVDVFREVRRVLRADGTVWLNLGDSYAAGGGVDPYRERDTAYGPSRKTPQKMPPQGRSPVSPGLKPKDLVGIPWRVAFALQADGWYLRSDIIWAKPNPMPESVTDRPTKSHEMIFLLAKSPRYFFDADAVRERIGEAGVVEGSNGSGEALVFGQDLGLESKSPHSNAVGVRLASAILERTGRQDEIGLWGLDAEVGSERGQNGTGAWSVGDPVVRHAAFEATRFADGYVAAEEFLREMDRLCVALPDGHDLKELRARCAPAPLVDPDSDAAVAVHDSREVGQLQLIHDEKYTGKHTHRSVRERNVGGRSDGFTRMPGGEAEWAERGLAGRNLRSVWTIATQPYPGAHFATFPAKLVEPCIKAGTSERGVCPECGAPWVRVVERTVDFTSGSGRAGNPPSGKNGHDYEQATSGTYDIRMGPSVKATTTGWQSSCVPTSHPGAHFQPIPASVLDPFAGSGTTGLVAQSLGRRAILIDLSTDYMAQILRRNAQIPLPA